MRIVECVIVSLVLMVTPPHCSSSPVQQNKTALPVRAALFPDVSPQRCGDAPNISKVQQRLRGFPGGRTPLDPLSISPVKPKRNRQRRIKPSQKKRPAAGSLDQIVSIQSSSFTPVTSQDISSVDQTQQNSRNNQQKIKPTQRSETSQRSSSDHLRTQFPKTGSRTGFSLPVDRIGLGRLPAGRR